ncbi:aryl hydrocarbon receptor nuclear translocator-like protein 2 isoform X4 [Monomorium pharaonis]|uniref:aryl hydrocarbon receptor nuclear translocator-like protein 2 isoform X4 n=1 Tax=Monomorium pharaonis TaxID=307658 RepID=UPI00063EF2CD|nr:aryl hydrocarbon receptor nuclear translocator-like protein 2 isoform X4 [Monomorium pharaonis]
MKDDVDEEDFGISFSGNTSVENTDKKTDKKEEYGNSSRTTRNHAEKQRRDSLNGCISEMAIVVPSIAGSSRRMDKISILRLSSAYLRVQYTVGSGTKNFLPPLLNVKSDFDLEQFFVNNLVDGFFFVVTATGKIVYISRQGEQYFGCQHQNELLGHSLYDYIYPKDHGDLTRNLTPDGMQPMSSTGGVAQGSEVAHDNNSSSSSEESTTNHRTNERIKRFREQRRHFTIRMIHKSKNPSKQNDLSPQYECFNVSGRLRLAQTCTDTNGKRERQREMAGTSNDIVFVGVATLSKKQSITKLSILDASKSEYWTRHLVDGRIICCDHRVSVVAGYLSEEIQGLNAFAFMHKDDFRWPMIGLRQMYDRAETFGSSCYRLLTRSGEFIYLRTQGYLELDENTQTVVSFVCINSLVSEEEGIRLMKEMKERFSATVPASSRDLIRPADINTPIESISNSQSSDPKCSLEDKSQLEDAITHLISDLPSPVTSENCFSPSLMPHTQYVKATTFSPRTSPSAQFKIDTNKINRCAVIQNKSKVPQKQESKHTIGKLIKPSSAEQSPISDSESAMPNGKTLSMFEMMNAGHSSHGNVQNADVSVQSKILTPRKPGKSSRASRNHTSCLDVSQSVNAQERINQRNMGMLSPGAINESTACKIKVERGIEETFNCMEKQESIMQYFDDSASDSSIVSSGIEMNDRCPLKRIYSDENLMAMYNKKKLNDVYASTNTNTNMNNEQQRVSYLKCRSFATEYPTYSNEFNQYTDVNLQPTIAESPNSSLHEVGNDYQQLIDPAAPLIMTNHDEEQFIELQDLKEDTLLSSELDANPELMIKILDGLRNGSAGFENFNEAKIQQLTPDDQIVNDELSRTYYQLADSMALQESQINVLVRDLKNPALRIQRENLSQLQAEHNMQKRMLKSLQHDHCKMQVNIKQTLGI